MQFQSPMFNKRTDRYGGSLENRSRFLFETIDDIRTARSLVRVGASGHIMTAQQAAAVLDAGCDFVMLGKAAILNPSFPQKVEKNAEYRLPSLPVTESHPREPRLSKKFINYTRTWDGFVR